MKVHSLAIANIFVSFRIMCSVNQIGNEGYFTSMCNLVVIRKMISYHQKHLRITYFSNYDAANILLKASRSRLIQCLRQRAYAASRNSNTVVTVV
jgi:hypothetical protein